MDSLLFELIAVKFDLADKIHEVERLRREASSAAERKRGVLEEKEGRAADAASPASDKDAETDLHSRDMLFLACEEGLDEIVKGILSPKPTRQSVLGPVFGHALRRAARAGHVSIVKRLLGVDAHLTCRSTEEDFLFQTCVHAASAGGHEPVLRLLLAHSKEKMVSDVFLQDAGLMRAEVCACMLNRLRSVNSTVKKMRQR